MKDCPLPALGVHSALDLPAIVSTIKSPVSELTVICASVPKPPATLLSVIGVIGSTNRN